MNNINSISSSYVNATPQHSETTPQTSTETKNVPANPTVETKDVAANDVLNYMANQGVLAQANIVLSPNAMVNKYNSPEAQARIAEMMKSFEDGVIAGLGKFAEEIGAAPAYENLSDADKFALAAGLFASEN